MQNIIQNRITMVDITQMSKETFRLFMDIMQGSGDFKSIMQLFLAMTGFTSINFYQSISTNDIVITCVKEE